MATPCTKCKHKTVETIDGSNCSKCVHATGNAWPGFEPKYVDTDSVQPECRCTINPDIMKILFGEPWECKPKHEDKLDALRFAGKHLSAGMQEGISTVNKEIVDYITNDVKATMECFNKLKEETMLTTEKNLFGTTGRTSYNMFFDETLFTYGGRLKAPEIKDVIFNNPATIVFWKDGTKTVVKCQNKEKFDPEKGLAMAIVKKVYGNKGRYFDQIKDWTEPYEEQQKLLKKKKK